MIQRNLADVAEGLSGRWPVLTITGPRQSGKTTLCRMVFPEHRYVSLEAPDTREYAAADPRGFLSEIGERAVIDEVQRVPDLLSYIQVEVDEAPRPGRFVLTGSSHLGILETVSQSLAGRTAFLHLLPCSLDELRRFPDPPSDLFSAMHRGGFPAPFDRGIPSGEWFEAYITSYVERDVRQVLNIGDLGTFQTFLRLCAGRSGQIVNLTRIGADCGITYNTVKAWISVLEAGFIAFRLRPWSRNLGKREVRSPKLYFHDTGLACALLGIRTPEEIRHHPLRGALFEGWVITEILRSRQHRAAAAPLFYYRDHKGLEVDLIVERGTKVTAVELKSAETVGGDFFRSLRRFAERFENAGVPATLETALVYGGRDRQRRRGTTVLPWSDVCGHEWT